MHKLRHILTLGASHFSRYRIHVDGPLKPLMKCIKPQRLSNFTWGSSFGTHHHYFQKLCRSTKGCNYTFLSAFGLSAFLGSIKLFPLVAYSDGFDGLLDDHRLGLLCDSDAEKDRLSVLMNSRKMLVPLMLLLTVLVNWGHPVILAVKVALILLATKPTPLSVYVLVEQLRNQAIRQQPLIYNFQSLYAKKVEFADYLFLCLAKVELKDQEFTIIGILGGWWLLPVSSWQEASSMLKCQLPLNFS